MVGEARRWLANRRWYILFAMAYAASTLLLFDPFSLLTALAGILAPGSQVESFVINDAHFLGVALLILALAIGLIALPDRLIRRVDWWKTQCPRCAETKLKRIRRTKLDRLTSVSGIPFRRYQCDSCRWSGLRIDNDKL